MLRFLLLIGLVAGCARLPPGLKGEFPPTTVADAQAGSHIGERVRWGGTIVSNTLDANGACLEVVSHRLDRRARPRDDDETAGRFITCIPGFLDPEVYVAKREVTVVGTIEQSSRGKVGDYDYVYPRVAAETVHLWRERPPERDPNVYYGVGIGGGYWGPWWYRPGPGWGYSRGWGHGGGGSPPPPRPRR